MLLWFILLILTAHPVRGCGHTGDLRYELYLKKHQPGGEKQVCGGPCSRHVEHRDPQRLVTDSGKVAVLSCLASCSESITVFSVLGLHFAATCIWHFLPCTVLCSVLCALSPRLRFKTASPPCIREYLLNSFMCHQ